jgi:phage terminase small subunit
VPKAKGFKQKIPPHVMQRTFCENIALGATQTAAARVAGYSDPGARGSLLMKKPEIRTQIEELREETRKASLITRERAVEGLLESIEHARLVDDPGAMIRGWQELNRMHGFHAPTKLEVDLPEGTKQILNTLATVPKEKLLELLAEEEETSADVLDAKQLQDGSFQVPDYAIAS